MEKQEGLISLGGKRLNKSPRKQNQKISYQPFQQIASRYPSHSLPQNNGWNTISEGYFRPKSPSSLVAPTTIQVPINSNLLTNSTKLNMSSPRLQKGISVKLMEGNTIVNQNQQKIRVLENRIAELQQQKTQTRNFLQNKIDRLQSDNFALKTRLEQLQKKHHEKINKQEEFDLEDLLQKQISLNLQLRQEIQALIQKNSLSSEQCKLLLNENNQIKNKFKELQIENQRQLQKNQQKCLKLEQNVQQLQAQISRILQSEQQKIRNQELLMKSKEQNLVQLQIYIEDLKNQLQIKQGQFCELEEQLSTIKIERLQERDQWQQTKNECGKCRQLTKTIIRLNSQLSVRK